MSSGHSLSGDSTRFVDWARAAAASISIPSTDDEFDDLTALDEFVGDARIVALGESSHYIHEWNRFRCRLFKYLALHHGFTTFVLESALVEGRQVHDWVLGQDISWTTIVRDSITNAWGLWRELHELLHWMRAWNADPAKGRSLHFYGMDGTANWSHPHHALQGVLVYLEEVDPRLAMEMEQTVLPAAEMATLESTDALAPDEWDRLLAGIAGLVSRLEQGRVEYARRSSPDAFDWALRCAEVARDIAAMLRQLACQPEDGLLTFWNARDAAMADQLQWILEREGPEARILVGAHNAHLQHSPLFGAATSFSQYLCERIPRRTVRLIGAANARTIQPDGEPQAGSNQEAYARVGSAPWFLDLHKAPRDGPVAAWLAHERPDRLNFQYQDLAPGRAWDAILYVDEVHLATLDLPPQLRRGGVSAPKDLARYSGEYQIQGFMGQQVCLTVELKGAALVADGRHDTSGELFPPAPRVLVPLSATEFTWSDWPAVLSFVEAAGPTRVEIEMPGMGTFTGERSTS